MVRGNHDNAVDFNMDCGCGYEIKDLSQEVRKITVEDVNKRSKEFLGNLPITDSINDHLLVHATRDNLFKYLEPDTPEKEFKDVEQYLIFLGHTHLQMDREIYSK